MIEWSIGLMVDKLQVQVRLLENRREIDHGTMKQLLHALLDSEHQLKSETTKLVEALRSPAGRSLSNKTFASKLCPSFFQ